MKNIKNIFESNKLLSSSSIGLFIKFINTILLFGTNIIVARELGEGGFAQFSLAFTAISVCIVIFQFGFPNYIVRSELGVDENSKGQSTSYHAFIASLCVSTGLFIIAVTIWSSGMVQITSLFLNYEKNMGLKMICISYMGACILLTNAYLRARGQSLVTIITDQLVVPIFVLIGIYVLWITSNFNLTNIISVYFGVNVLGLFVLSGWLVRSNYIDVLDIKALMKSLSRIDVYISLFAFSLCLILLNHIPVLILANSNYAESIAVFRVGYLLALPLLLIAYPINILAAPYISKADQDKDYSMLNNQLSAVVKMISVLALIYSIVIIIFSEIIILEIFNFESDRFGVLVSIILINNLIAVAFGPVGLILNIIGKEKYVLIVLLIALLGSTFLMIILVDYIGVIGLAVISMLVTCVWKFVLLYKVKQEIGIDCSIMSEKRNSISA